MRQHTIKATIRPGVVRNLREAVALHLEGEDLDALGLAPSPTVIVTMELSPIHA